MSKIELRLHENSIKTVPMISAQLSRELTFSQVVDGCIGFAGLMFACAQEDELFRENLNNVMGTDDFKKFFTAEDG